MIYRGFLKYKKSLAYIISMICLSVCSQALSFSGTYSHYSDKENISSVLTDFARAQGLKPQISDGIEGVMSGRFDRVDPKLFLDGLYAAFGVRYYLNGKNIHFYNESEWTQSVFRPASLDAADLVATLKNSGLIVQSLPVSADAGGFITVKGPAYYVEGIISQAEILDRSITDRAVMRVFKLKHAKAEDIHVASMDKTVVVPGIASILQRMVTGGSQGSAMSVTMNQARVPGLLGQGLSSVGSASTSVQDRAATVKPEADAGPSIIADSRLNAIIIQDASYRMPYYEEVIAQLDVPVQLVELHAAIVDVDTDASRNLGIDWRGSRSSGNFGGEIGQGNIDMGPDGFPKRPAAGGIFSTIFQTANSSFMMSINMLEEQNKAKTLGRPSVLTLDNIEATLEDTTTRYVPIAGKEVSDLFKVESGTVLRVTPHIIHDDDGSRLIQMVISLQSNQDANDSAVNAGGTTTVPPIKQTRINTQAVVREGQSLLLGGYYVEYKKAGDSGVPGLKDIPGAGVLFGSEGNDSFRRERLLMITPRILSLDDLNVPADIDEPTFLKSPTQADYNNRISAKADDSGGCSSNRNANGRSAAHQGAVTP